MAINDIVQTIAEARVDARSLSEFVFKPAGFKVARRLATTVDTLQFYINRFNSLNGDFSSSVSVALSSLNNSVAEADGKVAYIETTVQDAINNTVISSGFVTVDSFELGATLTQRNQALRHTATGNLYRWAGDLPKVVAASSTPTNSGGFGDNAWLEVSDVTLRQDLANPAKAAAMVAGGSIIYRPSVQQLLAITTSQLVEGQAAKVRGTEFAWNGSEWEPVSNIYVNSWGARGDAPARPNNTDGTNSRQAFIEAADYAHQHGHKYVFAEPGIYYAPDLLASEMHDLYVVGDGVQFTYVEDNRNSGHAQIHALTTQDYSNGVGWGSKKSTGRGRIAFEFDDAYWTQFVNVLPLFKKYGVPYGIALHTSYDRPWIREVHRHGNEILAHLYDDIRSTTFTRQQLEAFAIADLDVIEAITGYRDGVNFVYPAHDRSAETDDILSQYYASGRGLSDDTMSTPSFFGSWLCTAWLIDNPLITGDLSGIFSKLKTLRDNDLDLVLYAHTVDTTKANNLEKVIEYALHLGIEITLPRNLKPTHQMLSDRYFKDFENYDGNGKWDTTVHSEFGTRSRKFSFTGTGYGITSLRYNPIKYIRSKKDFSKLRVSFLYKSEQGLAFAPTSGAGIGLRVTYWRVSGGGSTTGGGFSEDSIGLPMPPSDFDNRISFDVYVPRSISRFQFSLLATNFVQPAEFWIDDLKVEKIDEVDSVYLRGTLINMGANGALPILNDTVMIGVQGVDFDSSYSTISKMDGDIRKVGLLCGTNEHALDAGKEVQAVVSLIRGHTD